MTGVNIQTGPITARFLQGRGCVGTQRGVVSNKIVALRHLADQWQVIRRSTAKTDPASGLIIGQRQLRTRCKDRVDVVDIALVVGLSNVFIVVTRCEGGAYGVTIDVVVCQCWRHIAFAAQNSF